MAERPVFRPPEGEPWRIREDLVSFTWHAGLSRAQKQKCIEALHAAAREALGVRRPLEISSASPAEIGRASSAFVLEVETPDGQPSTVESVFQGSKVFGDVEGPFPDLYRVSGAEARRDPRLVDPATGERRKPTKFKYGNEVWPAASQTAFYDWLYIRALLRRPDLADQLAEHDAFTDIAFNPARSLNCQARAAAVYLALLRRTGGGTGLERLCEDPERFRDEHRKVMPSDDEASSPVSNAEATRQDALFETPPSKDAARVSRRRRGGRAGGVSR